VSVPRRTTPEARLARLGFADPARAERLLTGDLAADPDGADRDLIRALAEAADPDLALVALSRLPRDQELLAALRAEPELRTRLVAVLGASAALGDHLARHPGHWRMLRPDGAAGEPGRLAPPAAAGLRAELLAAVGARPDDPEPVAGAQRPGGGGEAEPVAALRVAYRRRLLPLAARDLTGEASLDEVAAELADLAAAVLEAALAIARSQLPPGSAPCRLAVIAMGKCGARELNYASDVDVIFVAEPAAANGGSETAALRTASQLAAGLIRACSQSTPEGALFPVDPNLRPEGRDGPLVRTLASHQAYYRRWAKTWEFQALLKARGRRSGGRLRRGAQPAGLAGLAARELRGRRAGDAAAGDRHPARRAGRPPAQARARRAA
jgi:[glutamine synthetase] adenylyltransferase / [glutamine synthetase]-adenylyl-L-tyrosine phosphorylase